MTDYQEFYSQTKQFEDDEVEKQLREKVKPRLTRSEYREQQISVIYGEMGDKYGISRKEVEEFVDNLR